MSSTRTSKKNKSSLKALLKEVTIESVNLKVKEDGEVTGSVTSKTNYLVNNDALSTSSKNRKAKELGIPILTEDEFVERFGA